MSVPNGLYAIILGAGSMWEQQCGGYACNQRKATGLLMGMEINIEQGSVSFYGEREKALSEYFTGPKWNGWCTNKIDEDTANFIEKIVPEFIVDRKTMNEDCEAWVLGFVNGKPAILVWENSD